MSNRRTRSSRARKARPVEAPPATVQESGAPEATPVRAPADPTQTGELRALDAGWDEILG
jgi:hypothetical protein